MANLVSVERASLAAGTTLLLDEVSLGVAAGQRIGVVGRNGSGKTSLLRVLAGEQPVDSGRVARAGSLSVGRLTQADDMSLAATVRHLVVGDRAEHHWAGDAAVREILTGLLGGVDAPAVGGLDVPVAQLSGGERRRVALAALLAADPDLLLLDEPTNHLDVEGVAWLAAYLSSRRARAGTALVVVTHDRWFLDAAVDTTWEVADGNVHSYEGGYAAYVLARAERERVGAVREERRANLLRKELAWLRRGAPARTSKPRFRLDAASALIADEPAPRDSVSLVRFAATRLGKDVIELEDATVRLGERPVLDRVTWRLGPGDRLGVVGVNGAGKSTLLRALSGAVALDGGRRKVGATVVLAVLTQDVAELAQLADLRVLEAVEAVRRTIRLGDKEVSASQLAERLGFVGGRQRTRVGDLSGGERRRLQILRLLMAEPNVLLLDEPTNDLDIDTLTSLEDVLDGWAGCLVVVSHDRYLLERVCDRQVALFGDGRLRDLPGGVEEYLRLRAEGGGPTTSAGAGTARSPVGSDSAVSPAGERARPGGIAQTATGKSAAPGASAAAREARKALARLERQLDALTQQEALLHQQLADVATDHAAVLTLDARLRDLTARRDELETAWLSTAEDAE